MIYEFAVDPAVVATWHERDRYRFFKGKFGLGCPRVLSMFPDPGWARRVLNDFDKVFAGSPSERQDARKRLEALLVQLDVEASRRRGTVASEQSWLPDAEVEHGQRPFHRLLSTSNPRSNADVLLADDVDEETPGWHMECGPVRRTADAIAAALAPMLRFAREVKLVDPYFGAPRTYDRWLDTLLRVLQLAHQRRRTGEGVSVEFHTSVEWARHKEPLSDVEAERVAAHMLRTCKDQLPRKLPAGTALTVVIWSEKHGGEQFHNRLVLTDVGGVLIGTGLDAHEGRVAHDNFVVLPREQYVDRWRQLHPDSNVFKPRGRRELIVASSSGSRPRRT